MNSAVDISLIGVLCPDCGGLLNLTEKGDLICSYCKEIFRVKDLLGKQSAPKGQRLGHPNHV